MKEWKETITRILSKELIIILNNNYEKIKTIFKDI